jgi:hypothetical protein
MQIKLTMGKHTEVDEADYGWLKAYTWCVVKTADKTPKWYAKAWIPEKKKMAYMHRMIMGDTELKVDHKNGDGLDNRRENLRYVNNYQHAQNSRRKLGKSGVLGVYWNRYTNRWRAEIRCNGKKWRIGWFKTLEEAREAREKAMKELHGEYAVK